MQLIATGNSSSTEILVDNVNSTTVVFNSLIPKCAPGGSLNLTFDAKVPAEDGVSIGNNVYFDIDTRSIVQYQSIGPSVQFRKCKVGEFYDFLDTRTKCVECFNNEYSFLENLDNSVISCTPCVDGAMECYGNVIELYPGVKCICRVNICVLYSI